MVNSNLKIKNESCPCLHTTPCHKDCTCVNEFSSRGCRRCCSYGSKEQQKKMAEILAKKIDTDVVSETQQLLEKMYPGLSKVDICQQLQDWMTRAVDTDKNEAEAVERLEKETAEWFQSTTDAERKRFLSNFKGKEREEILRKYSGTKN